MDTTNDYVKEVKGLTPQASSKHATKYTVYINAPQTKGMNPYNTISDAFGHYKSPEIRTKPYLGLWLDGLPMNT